MPMQWWRKITNYTVLNLASVYGGYCRKKQLKDSQRIDSISEKQLLDFVHKNKNTVYGQKYGFDHIHTIQDYQDQVPFTTYDDYRDYVNRIAENGEQNVLTADKVVFFAKTSGTSGEMKRIPVVKKSYQTLCGNSGHFYEYHSSGNEKAWYPLRQRSEYGGN